MKEEKSCATNQQSKGAPAKRPSAEWAGGGGLQAALIERNGREEKQTNQLNEKQKQKIDGNEIQLRWISLKSIVALRLSKVDEFAGYGPEAICATPFHSKEN